MLGPSGSGKTTVLRLIAGFEPPDGRHGAARRRRTSPSAAPFDRDVNTVFQDYALFPHMSVRRQRRLRPAGARRGQARAPRAGRRGAGDGARSHGTEKRSAHPALRRPAAARRAGPRARRRPAGAAARRAARRPGPQAARADAGRAQADPARRRDHLRLRHPRPGGGAHAERPDRGLQRRAGSSRSAAADEIYERPGVAVRRRVRRHLEPARRATVAAELLGAAGTFAVRPEKIAAAPRRTSDPVDGDVPGTGHRGRGGLRRAR